MNIGVLGGGQLGRMLALAGYALGLRFRFFDPAPDATARHLAEHIVAEYHAEAALARFADGLDVVTYEFENVPVTTARFLEKITPVFPRPIALEVAQDRLAEKTFFQEQGIPTARFAPVDSREALDAAISSMGLPAVLKTRRMGYDGKGQWVLRMMADGERAWAAAQGAPLILEQFVPFTRELSILTVRGRDGATAFYPLIENEHREGILRVSRVHQDARMQTQAESYARRVVEALDYVGLLAIELFEVDGQLLANEMAPRVHNSGHWTIEGALTSQFENHLRAVMGWPLGASAARGHAAMVNLIGALPDVRALLAIAGAHLHLYDKAPRAGRKLGHVTLVEGSREQLDSRLAEVRKIVVGLEQS